MLIPTSLTYISPIITPDSSLINIDEIKEDALSTDEAIATDMNIQKTTTLTYYCLLMPKISLKIHRVR